MAPKTRSFLHFLEWSKKPQKKLFPDGQASIEGKNQDEIDGHDDKSVPNVPLIDEDEKSGVSSIRDINDHSCSSSVTDKEESRTRAPGVVAKLMGLESLPSSGILLSNSHNIRDNPGQNQRKNSNYVILKAGANSRTLDLWSPKMPGNPIERFQVEALPPRLVKSISVTRHKLLSPVKNLGLDSVKISEPEVQKKTKSKVQPSKPSPSPSEIFDSTKVIATLPKSLKALELPGRRIQSVSLKSSRSQALCRRDVPQNDKSLTSKDESSKSGAKEKNKSVSLAIQAKLNVQTRKGISPRTSNKFVSQEDNKSHSGKPLQVQSSNPTHTYNKGNSDADSHNVHQPNKQDYLVTKSKLGQRLSVSDTSEQNALSRDGSSRKQKLEKDCVRNKKERNSMIKGSEVSRVAKDLSITNYKKVVLVESKSYCKRSDSVDNLPLEKQRKHIRHNVVVSDNSGWSNVNATCDRDVVSFTFTSPLTKLHGYSPHYRDESGNEEKKKGYRFCSYSGNSSDSDDKNLLSRNLNVKDGDHLGFILEHRLKELASMSGSPSCISVKDAGVGAHLSDSIDSASTSNSPGVAYTDYQSESLLQSFDDEVCSSTSNSLVNSVRVPHKRDKLQGKNRIGSYCNIADQSEIEHQDQSPLSIPDNSFSNESCSSESYQNFDGTRTNSSHYSSLSTDVADVDSMYKTGPAESKVEFSTSSLHKQAIESDEDLDSEIGRIENAYTCWDDLNYVKEILNNWEIISDDSILRYMDQSSEILDPHLFEKLEENQISVHVEEMKRMRRKIYFDAVNECLSTKCSFYFQVGFQMWAKGLIFVRKDLSEELYNEISGCVCGEDWMVDELVYKDMSARRGRWIDFEIEAFEAAVEIERWLLDTLVDEFFKEFYSFLTPVSFKIRKN